MIRKVWSLARLIIIDGLRRHALLGLLILAIALEVGGMILFDFIPRDIGRASADFILSIGWLTGFIFLFFHAVQTIAWDEERRTIHTVLARPITRRQYVLGIFTGLALLLLILNCILAIMGFFVLDFIKGSVKPVYFSHLSTHYYLFAWIGLFCIEIIILSVIMLFSGLIRGGFPVLLLSISYYFICIGLPVVRESLRQKSDTSNQSLELFLKVLTSMFPDFNKFDFKALITSDREVLFFSFFSTDILLMLCYVTIILWCAAAIYQRRDLQ